MRTNALIFLPAVVMLFGACVGGGVVHTKQKQLLRFAIAERGGFKFLGESAAAANPTKGTVVKTWGQPDRVRHGGNVEVWVYHTGVKMAGVVPMVGMGIPLVIPAGRNRIELYFAVGAERPFKAIQSFTTWSGGYYEPGDVVEGNTGFHAFKD